MKATNVRGKILNNACDHCLEIDLKKLSPPSSFFLSPFSSAETACGEVGNAAEREETGSSAPNKLSAEQAKGHLPESKTAETELTVVTMVPVVTRYLTANNVSQEVVTPGEDVGASLPLKVPASPAKVSTYGGDRPIPALIKSEYFRASAERGSLSLSRSFSSSELDYDRAQQKEAHAGDGRRVLGATLTLRQVNIIRLYSRCVGLFVVLVRRPFRDTLRAPKRVLPHQG